MMKQLFCRGQKPLMTPKAGDCDPFEELYQQGKIWAAQHKEQAKRIVISHVGVKLAGYYYNRGTDRTVILVHGFGSSYLERLGNASLYYDRGFNVLAVISRGHGESGGQYRTLGYKDSKDVVCWANYLVRKENQTQIILDGVSMGGAAVVAASGNSSLPKEVKGIVSDCSFTSMEEVIRFHLKKDAPFLPDFFVLPVMKQVSWKKYGVSLEKDSPIEEVKHAKVPILFIHGVDDAFVPYEMGRTLHMHCASESFMISVKGAGHAESCVADSEGYSDAVGKFLDYVTE